MSSQAHKDRKENPFAENEKEGVNLIERGLNSSKDSSQKEVILKVIKSPEEAKKNVVYEECANLMALIKTNIPIDSFKATFEKQNEPLESLDEASWYLENDREQEPLLVGKTEEDVEARPIGTLNSWREWLMDLKAPIAVLVAVGFIPKLILVWSATIIAKPVVTWFYDRCSERWQRKFKEIIPVSIRDSEFREELSEGLDQGLPFILFWLYLYFIPFAIAWMLVDWVKKLFFRKEEATSDLNDKKLSFKQRRDSDLCEAENNFYYSKVYGIVVIAFFALGIPALISFSLYQCLGIEKNVEHTFSVPPVRSKSEVAAPIWKERKFTSLASRRSPAEESSEFPVNTVVMGYTGSFLSFVDLSTAKTRWFVFLVLFYLPSLGVALTAVFFRAWFLFPLNFLSSEHEVDLTASSIRRKGTRDWFLNVITFNRFAVGGGPDSLKWSKVRSLGRVEEGFTKLYPLPDNAFAKETLTYKLLNKVAAFYDGITNKVNSANELVFSSNESGADGGKNIKIDLNSLSQEDRARLYYSVRNWASHVIIPKDIEKELLGSNVFHDVKYTQLWFDLLTEKDKESKEGHLLTDDQLRDGDYVIESRLHSGGQATTYLARKTDGSICVLKEFILAQSDTSGALIESAREFEVEVNLLSQLEHPGIVKIEDYFTEHARVYAVLEYIEGKTLREKVSRQGALSESEVVEIGSQVLDILEYLHGQTPSIVHRDVTPENLMITPDRKVILIDFSLASNDKELTNNSCGKQGYTPPEQFREEASTQSDIYALGATLHYLLTGANPKPVKVSSPQKFVPTISDELNAIVERATQLDLENRYESAHWFKLDLENCRGRS